MTLGAHDLIEAACEAYRWRHAHPDLAGYHARRYELLRAALGVKVDLVSADANSFANSPIERVLRSTVAAMATIPSPFSGTLEAPRDVNALYQAHGRLLQAAADELRSRLAALAVDALKSCDRGVAARTSTREALIAAGLPEEPDPIDYL